MISLMSNKTLAAWHAIASSANPAGLNDLLADEVVFLSPVVHTPQVGKALARGYLTAAMKVLNNETFKYVREIVGPNDAVLEFEVQIDGISLNGVDLIKWNEAGKIIEFKVMVRPLKAITLLQQKMATMLQAAAAAH
jgi:SnoaL-like domain